MQHKKPRLNRRLRTLVVALSLGGCGSDGNTTGRTPPGSATFDAGRDDGGHRDAEVENPDEASGDAQTHSDAGSTCVMPATFSVPNAAVWLIIERSKTQNPTEQMLEKALVGEGGLLEKRTSEFLVGAVVHGGDPAAENCADLTAVAPKLNNGTAVKAAYPAPQGSDVQPLLPYAMTYLNEHLPTRTSFEDPAQAVVLVRYGSADQLCSKDGDSLQRPPETTPEQTAMRLVRDGTQQLVQRGAGVFVVDFGASETLPSESDILAALGNTGMEVQRPQNAEELSASLDEIFRRARGCTLALKHPLKERLTCTGSVKLRGEPLLCGDSNGFTVVAEGAIQLSGTACEALRDEPTAPIEVDFPFDAYAER